MTERVKQKLSELPKEPGVYFHKNSRGTIIYVGKAAVLRNRVRQYFQSSRTRDPKTEALVREITDIDWITTESEIDALILEAELIKRYLPRYNIELRDDKSNLYVRIDMKSEHPCVTFVRRPLDDGAEYFGPYQHGPSVRRALKFLRRVFPYDTKPAAGKRVSLDYHLGLSPGLEEGKTTLQQYRSNLRHLAQYLRGDKKKLVKELEREMKQAAKAKEFERAAQLRNQVLALQALSEQIIFSDREFMDISKDQGLSGLAELLGLPQPPRRIEGYDISHMQGTDTVASMVVFSNGMPDKAQYRKFHMRLPGNDDFAHMHEVIFRRFSGKNLEAWAKPDLVLIDGGKGQLSSALAAMAERGIELPAIGLAKRQEEIIIKRDDGFEALLLPKNSHVIKLLQRIRDESHRFAVSYHSTLKRKRHTSSLLEDIPTVGPTTRKKLLRTFGSLKGLMQARDWEVEKVVGAKKAAIIMQYLRAEKRAQRIR